MLNQLETSGPAPASEIQINNLPDEVITNDHLEKSDQCSICMDEYKLTDKAKKLPCKHYFHEACIGQWLKIVRNNYPIKMLYFEIINIFILYNKSMVHVLYVVRH